jgi:uncharacterized protein with HEPN domain
VKKAKREYRMHLDDMNLSMARIAEYIKGMTFSDFKNDYKTTDAVIRNFEVIGKLLKIFLNHSRINIPISHGKKCICFATRFHMNTLELIMR